MNLLLDTHVLLWLDTDPARLSPKVAALIRNRQNTVYVSAISVWELAIKHRIGKLPSAAALLSDFHASMTRRIMVHAASFYCLARSG